MRSSNRRSPCHFSLVVGGEPGKISHLGIPYSGNGAVALPRWRVHRSNDPAIYRLDSSGTNVWTNYIPEVSPDWQKTLGVARERRSGGTGQANSRKHRLRSAHVRDRRSAGRRRRERRRPSLLTSSGRGDRSRRELGRRDSSGPPLLHRRFARQGFVPDQHGHLGDRLRGPAAGRDKLVNNFLRWAIPGEQQYAKPLSYVALLQALAVRAESQIIRSTAARQQRCLRQRPVG